MTSLSADTMCYYFEINLQLAFKNKYWSLKQDTLFVKKKIQDAVFYLGLQLVFQHCQLGAGTLDIDIYHLLRDSSAPN